MAKKFVTNNGKFVLSNNKMVYQEPVSSGETWVLNETLTLSTVDESINFESNDTSYNRIVVAATGTTGFRGVYYYIGTTLTRVYTNYNVWLSEAYRTVTFSTAPTGDLLTWLQANAVKQ